jgi:hypothetical protein
MAVKQGTRVRRDDGVVVYTWTDVDAGDTGSPALVTDEGPLDVQITGTIGTSVATLEGSMDGTTWATITVSPTPLVAATISRASQRALFIRPALAAGTGADIVFRVAVTPGKV